MGARAAPASSSLCAGCGRQVLAAHWRTKHCQRVTMLCLRHTGVGRGAGFGSAVDACWMRAQVIDLERCPAEQVTDVTLGISAAPAHRGVQRLQNELARAHVDFATKSATRGSLRGFASR